MNKRTIQIDVIGPIEETELMKCKLYVDGRVHYRIQFGQHAGNPV